jgi:hypothetical protein
MKRRGRETGLILAFQCFSFQPNPNLLDPIDVNGDRRWRAAAKRVGERVRLVYSLPVTGRVGCEFHIFQNIQGEKR